MFSEDNAAHLAKGLYMRIVMVDLNLLGRMWQLTITADGALQIKKKNVRQTANTTCSGLAHLTTSLSRIVCRGQVGPEGSKRTLRPDLQANSGPRISFKKPMSHTR
jgi:hypothetical protein